MPGAPVIVVATHLDKLPSNKRHEEQVYLQKKFQNLYVSTSKSNPGYPDVFPRCFFVSCNDGTNIAQLRDEIHELALSIKTSTGKFLFPRQRQLRIFFFPGGDHHRKGKDSESLLRQPIPVCYISLQEIVREKARECIQNKAPPILTTKEFR